MVHEGLPQQKAASGLPCPLSLPPHLSWVFSPDTMGCCGCGSGCGSCGGCIGGCGGCSSTPVVCYCRHSCGCRLVVAASVALAPVAVAVGKAVASRRATTRSSVPLGGWPTSRNMLQGTSSPLCWDLQTFWTFSSSGSPKYQACNLIERHLIRSQKYQIQVYGLPEQPDHEQVTEPPWVLQSSLLVCKRIRLNLKVSDDLYSFGSTWIF